MAKPDSSTRVKVDGHEVVTYSYGDSNAEVLFLLNGGPGLPSDYLREPLLRMVKEGYRVVTYDQLGCGKSDRPTDPGLWTIGRYVEEVEAVREALGGGRVHLLGHSWGGWLGIEYAITHPDRLKSCIFSSTGAHMPAHLAELRRLLGDFGAETLTMVDRLEAAGQVSS